MPVLIETPRLQMREFTLDDAEAVLAFATNDQVNRYTGESVAIDTVDKVRELIQNVWLAEYAEYGYGRYALVHKGDDRVIGFCGPKFVKEVGRPDLGYRMLPEYWGQGLGFEAATAALAYCRETLELHDIYADVLIDNVASCRILEKIGFQNRTRMEEDGLVFYRYEP